MLSSSLLDLPIKDPKLVNIIDGVWIFIDTFEIRLSMKKYVELWLIFANALLV